MANYITTLKDDEKVNNLIPRTVLKAVADDNGNYLDSGLTAVALNSLKNGDADDIRSSSTVEPFSTTATKNEGEYVLYNGVVYRCKANGTTGAWNSSKWDEVSLITNRDAISTINTYFKTTKLDSSLLTINTNAIKDESFYIYKSGNLVYLNGQFRKKNITTQTTLFTIDSSIKPTEDIVGVVNDINGNQIFGAYIQSSDGIVRTTSAMPSTLGGGWFYFSSLWVTNN